jgi:hypothetical protein
MLRCLLVAPSAARTGAQATGVTGAWPLGCRVVSWESCPAPSFPTGTRFFAILCRKYASTMKIERRSRDARRELENKAQAARSIGDPSPGVIVKDI